MMLRGCQFALAASRGNPAAQPRIEALRRAGAAVRLCVLSQNLWSALTEAAFELIVVLAERDDVESLAIYQQLREDPRTRALPALLVTDATFVASERGAIMLASDADDNVFVNVCSDLITPLRRAREAEQRERGLRQELRDELARAARSTQQFRDLNHELRAMFGAIYGFGCNMRDEFAGPLSNDQRSHVGGILDAVERATKLLERQPVEPVPSTRPASTAPGSGPPRAQRTIVQLARIATEVTALFNGVALQKSMKLRCSCDDSVSVWGDSLQLKQVVTNLVVNALKYTPAGREVNVQVRWSSGSGLPGVQSRRLAEVVVQDTGPGIAFEHREKIFERGYRIDQRSHVAGDGIGLSVVRELVTLHGGTVRVEGEVGQGSIFRVSLPQDRRQRAAEGAIVVTDGPAARTLLSLLPPNNASSALVGPEDRERFLQLALSCRATVLLAPGDELQNMLAKLSSLSPKGTDEGQDS